MTTKKEDIAWKIAETIQAVHNDLPNGREKSCLLTKLDEARHWLNDIRIPIEVLIKDSPFSVGDK